MVVGKRQYTSATRTNSSNGNLRNGNASFSASTNRTALAWKTNTKEEENVNKNVLFVAFFKMVVLPICLFIALQIVFISISDHSGDQPTFKRLSSVGRFAVDLHRISSNKIPRYYSSSYSFLYFMLRISTIVYGSPVTYQCCQKFAIYFYECLRISNFLIVYLILHSLISFPLAFATSAVFTVVSFSLFELDIRLISGFLCAAVSFHVSQVVIRYKPSIPLATGLLLLDGYFLAALLSLYPNLLPLTLLLVICKLLLVFSQSSSGNISFLLYTHALLVVPAFSYYFAHFAVIKHNMQVTSHFLKDQPVYMVSGKSTVTVAFGDGNPSPCWLNTRPGVQYPLRYPDGRCSSNAQVVGCYEFKTVHNWWKIEKHRYGNSDDDDMIRFGDKVTLRHLMSDCLLAAKNVSAPRTFDAMEVSCLHFRPGEVHRNAIWQLRGTALNSSVRTFFDKVTLVHESSSYSLTQSGLRLPEWGLGKLEIVAVADLKDHRNHPPMIFEEHHMGALFKNESGMLTVEQGVENYAAGYMDVVNYHLARW